MTKLTAHFATALPKLTTIYWATRVNYSWRGIIHRLTDDEIGVEMDMDGFCCVTNGDLWFYGD